MSSWMDPSPPLWRKNPDRKSSLSHVGGLGGFSRSGQSSMLQSVIRNLVDSVDEEDRITQRNKLEDDLTIASERLDALVQEHREKLHGTLDTFEKVDVKIRDSEEKIRMLKTSLQSCKNLLRCKREELKRLWLEDVKFKHMLKMIDTIEEVQGLPERLRKYKEGKHYLQATELLNNNVARLEGELKNVEALKDLKQELKQQKEHLHEELIDELHRHLYIKATARKTHHQLLAQQGASLADSQSITAPSPMKKTTPLSRHARSHSRTMAMEKDHTMWTPPTIMEVDDDQVRDELDVDPEENSHHYMAILIESLSILGKIPDALNAIQKRMEREFILIVERASVQVSRIAEQEVGRKAKIRGRGQKKVSWENQPRLLTKLLQICFERFRNVVSAHGVLLGHLQRTKSIYKRASFELYEESDVWAAVQHALQTVLEVYLAFDEESSTHPGMAGFTTFPASDMQIYFATKKKSAPKMTKKPLFRFDSSRHAISVISYMREQRDLELAEGGEGTDSAAMGGRHYAEDQPSVSQHMVCKPSARNITVVFGAVSDFVQEIEEALHLGPDDHCQLHHFLHEFVEQHFLDNVRLECAEKLNNCTKPEVAKTVASDQRTLKMTGSKQTVFNSVLVVWQLVEDLCQLMQDLPLYSTHFLSILCQLLLAYRDSCNTLYRELTVVAPDGSKGERGVSHESVISSKWARDEDINRMIRSLSNWMKLRQGKAHATEEENKQSVFAKESETLTNNLGSELLKKTNVVLNLENLRLLAILHESLDWFNSCLKQTVMDLASHSQLGGVAEGVVSPTETTDGAGMSRRGMELDEDAIDQARQALDLEEQLSKVQYDFQSLLEMAIIMLHLEVRCHCFYFLLPTVQKSSYVCDHESTEAEPAVWQLADDLKNIETVMVAILSPEKHRYLFEGLGHLVASIFITSTQHLKTINSSGIKKMCRNISVLQSCLSKITLIREKDLDRARHYFELLYLNDEEIFHQLTEQARVFSQKDYANALRLLAHSQPSFSEEKLDMRLKQLETIFSKDAV